MAASKKKSNTTFLRSLVKKLDNENMSIAADGLSAAEFTGYIDTGSYALNALVSGTFFGGIPNNKCIVFAGESSTGKTFVMLGIAKRFIDDHPDGEVIYYDIEAAITKDMLVGRGIDTQRIALVNLPTIQDFQTHALQVLEAYKESHRPPLLMILDSLGALTSIKASTDAVEGKNVRDMTLQQLIRGTFRNIRLALAKVGVPLLVTQHTYTGIGQWGAPQQISGGGGIKYAADDIIILSGKSKVKDTDKTVVGNDIKASTFKSRLSRENQDVHIRISYDHGLSRYFGLEDIAKKLNYKLPEGDLDAEEWDKILPELEIEAKKRFSYSVQFPDEDAKVTKKEIVTEDGEIISE